jgi:hypothetical protein
VEVFSMKRWYVAIEFEVDLDRREQVLGRLRELLRDEGVEVRAISARQIESYDGPFGLD